MNEKVESVSAVSVTYACSGASSKGRQRKTEAKA